jgi:hypothetical protein
MLLKQTNDFIMEYKNAFGIDLPLEDRLIHVLTTDEFNALPDMVNYELVKNKFGSWGAYYHNSKVNKTILVRNKL